MEARPLFTPGSQPPRDEPPEHVVAQGRVLGLQLSVQFRRVPVPRRQPGVDPLAVGRDPGLPHPARPPISGELIERLRGLPIFSDLAPVVFLAVDPPAATSWAAARRTEGSPVCIPAAPAAKFR